MGRLLRQARISNRDRTWPGWVVGLCGGLALVAGVSCERVKDLSARIVERVAAAEKSGEAVERREPSLMDSLAEEPFSVIPPPPKAKAKEVKKVVDKEAQVSVLLYHDFTEDESNDDMVVNIDRFREQMQVVKDSGIAVIGIEDFLAWRRGEKNIPDQSVMITIDDGWKATHTLALPVLKEFGYPFTLFLYKKYVGGFGRSLTYNEIKEIMAAGGVIGSHSVSHERMLQGDRSDEEYEAWLEEEFKESYEFLVNEFGEYGTVLKVFAYPYGIYSNQVAEKGRAMGYDVLFTVNRGKVNWDSPAGELGRYIIYGKTGANFTEALTFKGATMLASGRRLMAAPDAEVVGGVTDDTPLVTTRPADGEKISARLPLIEMDVSKLVGVEPESIRMRVSGLGEVPHEFDPTAGVIRYQVPQKLRSENCNVQVVISHEGSEKPEVIAWKFRVDLGAGYLPQKELRAKAKPVTSAVDPVDIGVVRSTTAAVSK